MIKHTAICDRCGTEEPATQSGHSWIRADGWLHTENKDLCGECVIVRAELLDDFMEKKA